MLIKKNKDDGQGFYGADTLKAMTQQLGLHKTGLDINTHINPKAVMSLQKQVTQGQIEIESLESCSKLLEELQKQLIDKIKIYQDFVRKKQGNHETIQRIALEIVQRENEIIGLQSQLGFRAEMSKAQSLSQEQQFHQLAQSL